MADKTKHENENKNNTGNAVSVTYTGSNPSYTAGGISFSKENKTKAVAASIAERLLATGKFIVARADGQADG